MPHRLSLVWVRLTTDAMASPLHAQNPETTASAVISIDGNWILGNVCLNLQGSGVGSEVGFLWF